MKFKVGDKVKPIKPIPIIGKINKYLLGEGIITAVFPGANLEYDIEFVNNIFGAANDHHLDEPENIKLIKSYLGVE